MCHLIKVKKLIIDRDLGIVRARRQKAFDLGPHGRRTEKAKNRHALVPLHHVKTVEVFHGHDGVADTLLHMGGGETRPFGGKLASFFQKRIEGRRKRLSSGSRKRSDDLLDIDACAAEIDLVEGAHVRQYLFQRREIRIFVPGCTYFYFFQAQSAGLLIGTCIHKKYPLPL